VARTQPKKFLVLISYSRFSGKTPTADDVEKALDDYFNKGQDKMEKFIDNKSDFYVGGFVVKDLDNITKDDVSELKELGDYYDL